MIISTQLNIDLNELYKGGYLWITQNSLGTWKAFRYEPTIMKSGYWVQTPNGLEQDELVLIQVTKHQSNFKNIVEDWQQYIYKIVEGENGLILEWRYKKQFNFEQERIL